jgi:hypothetical protein
MLGGHIIRHGFPSSGAAWRWLDRNERRETWVRSETANWTGAGVYHDRSPAAANGQPWMDVGNGMRYRSG